MSVRTKLLVRHLSKGLSLQRPAPTEFADSDFLTSLYIKHLLAHDD